MSGTSAGAAKRWRCPKCGQLHRKGAKCSKPGKPSTSWIPRFRALIDVRGPDECWPWKGYIVTSDKPTPKRLMGYGQFTLPDGRKEYAHRIAYKLGKGPIPPGRQVLHTCDNPPCCNKRHLRLGTQQDNINDMMLRKRHWRQQT